MMAAMMHVDMNSFFLGVVVAGAFCCVLWTLAGWVLK